MQLSKALSAEHSPKYCSPSSIMVTSPLYVKYSWAGRITVFNQSIIACEGLQTLDLCSAFRAFEQEGIFNVWHGTSVFPVSSGGPPHLIDSYDSQGDLFEQGRIFIVPHVHLLWHDDLVFPVSSEGPSHLIASYDLQGNYLIASYDSQRDAEDLLQPGSSWIPIHSDASVKQQFTSLQKGPMRIRVRIDPVS
jgi:hypothetical protein